MDRRDKKHAQYLLANLIVDMARSLRLKVGHHFTEQWLAEALSVSRTPVRSALKLLADRGVVEARRNQGFFLAIAWNELEAKHTLDVPSTPEEALYTTLVRDRLAGRLSDSITQTDLARLYSVNRVVLLRTLSRMSDEGLIARNKGQGWTFLPTIDSASARRSSYEYRMTVEPAGILLPGFSIDVLALKRMQADHDFAFAHAASMSDGALFELDASFHETIAGFSGNAYFLQAVQQQNRLRRLFEYQSYPNRPRVRVWLREHLTILKALEADNRADASQLLFTHLENAIARSS
ncbi:MAG: GntR family transcriptional regulator [Alsobacter sp.]